MSIDQILQNQREFFLTQQTKDLAWRRAQLIKLRDVMKSSEHVMYEAIGNDFGKSRFETFATEISFIYNDIEYYLKNLSRLAKPRSVGTNLVNMPGSSKVHYEPLGNALVIGAWNYPYQLSLSPLVAAVAAGNTVILKPSEIAEQTMRAMAELINSNFDEKFLYVAEGGVEMSTQLLELKFDKIFFTGSTRVGKIVYEAAARQLTPVTLELGGKSPVVVTESADLDVAAKRIVWGKFMNAGQTCVAPDYILADEKIETKLLERLKLYIDQFKYEPGSSNYTRIINQKNFERLQKLIQPEKIYYGGDSDAEKLYLQPTVLKDIRWEDDVMKEEIFGPVLPVLSFKNFDDALGTILQHEKPLAAYLFSGKREDKERFTAQLSFGGGCINDVMMHLSNHRLPFGGVGYSGMGSYHGPFGFAAFSHRKAVLERATWGEPDLKYPPYTEQKAKWIKKLL